MEKVLIWGSEGGIGGAILDKFLAEGWEAAAISRVINPYREGVGQFYEADFSRIEDTNQVGEQLAGEGAKFDVMVYAAGDIASEKIREGDPERWVEIIDNNLTGAYHSLRVSLPHLKEGGHVFLLGAVSERLRLPGLTAYGAAKAGLEALAAALSKEERKITVTLIRPGAVDTDLWDKVPFKKPSHTYSPEQVAEALYQAYQDGQGGQLDLTG